MNSHLKAGLGELAVLLMSAVLISATESRGESPLAGDASTAFALHSQSFQENGDIPKKFTCSGGDLSPELSWNGSPTGTESFVLIVTDPDAPSGDFTHWVVYDIPATINEVSEAASERGTLPKQALEGRNDFGKIGYGGPCPPPGNGHRYVFTVYALGTRLNRPPGASRSQIEQAMQKHVLAQAELTARYQR